MRFSTAWVTVRYSPLNHFRSVLIQAEAVNGLQSMQDIRNCLRHVFDGSENGRVVGEHGCYYICRAKCLQSRIWEGADSVIVNLISIQDPSGPEA
jgi:hypothetical protein